ncbi:hypothetical protein ACFWDI_26630 [Streptomyces sp. NPDC060064]
MFPRFFDRTTTNTPNDSWQVSFTNPSTDAAGGRAIAYCSS